MPKGATTITFHRSSTFLPGKFPSAVAFAEQVAAHAKHVTGAAVGVAMPVGGNAMRIGWTSSYDSLGAMEAAMSKLIADPKYLELISRAGDSFMAGTTHDEIWREI
jgi:hypothetical protein